MTDAKVTLFFDGLCQLCSREIAHYRRHLKDNAVAFVDITDPTFDAQQHGLDPRAIHQTMHLKVQATGEIRTGVDAFLALWDAMPGYRWLNRLVRTPGIVHLARLGYAIFARLRPLLPRRKAADCASGTCPR